MSLVAQTKSPSHTTLDALLGACEKLLLGFRERSANAKTLAPQMLISSAKVLQTQVVLDSKELTEVSDVGSSDHPFRSYLSSLRHRERLDLVQETDHFRKLKEGSASDRKMSRDVLIQANLWVVPVIVRRFNRHSTGFEDLVAEGNLGLFRALETFEPERGLRFSTYAKWWVINAVTASMAANAYPLRLPKRVALQISKSRRTADLDKHLGSDVSNGSGPWDGQELELEEVFPRDSIPQGGSTGQDLEEDVASYGIEIAIGHESAEQPDAIVAGKETTNRLFQSLQSLSERQRYVIERRYGLNGRDALTLCELGAELGVSAERVRKIQNAAISKLRIELADILNQQ